MFKKFLSGVVLVSILGAAPAFAQTATPDTSPAVKAVNHAVTHHKHAKRYKHEKMAKAHKSLKMPTKHRANAAHKKMDEKKSM